ncbi:MAG: hypothetical protein R2695_03420 [Acidimicrobiales bacterium]
MRSSLGRALLVGLGLAITTNGPVLFVADHVLAGDAGWERPFIREVFVALALCAVVTVALDPLRGSGERLRRPSPVAAAAAIWFAAWAVASSQWSVAPELTRGRALIYVGLAAFAWIVADLDFDRFRLAMVLAFGACLASSLLVVVSASSVGIDKHGVARRVHEPELPGTGRLRGGHPRPRRPCRPQASGSGRGPRRHRGRGAHRVGERQPDGDARAHGGGGSASTLVVLGPGLVRRRPKGAALALALGVLVASAGLSGCAGPAVGEPTFAQRRTIWHLVWHHVEHRPLQGYGWFAIWSVPSWKSTHPLLARGSAHGSFMEVWLGLGLIGLLPFLAIIGLALFGVIRDARRRPGLASWTWMALVLFLVVENLTESFVLWFSYNWVLLTAAALRSGVGWRRRVATRRPAPSDLASV